MEKELLERILKSPSYRPAIEDPDFLRSDETRGIRLHLDYQKPESILRRFGIKRTIVLFGSARIVQKEEALKKIAAIEAQLREKRSKELQQKLQAARSLLRKSVWYEEARLFGALVGSSGKGPKDNTLILVTGGGPGIMEAGNRGAYEVGAKSAGFTIQLPKEPFPNPYVTPELCFRFHYFAIRKLHFLRRSCALVVFPGGYGTLDELFETLTLIQTQKKRKIPVVLVGREYWRRLIDFDFLVEEGTIDPEDRELFVYKDGAREAWEYIIKWYRRQGIDLFG